MKNLLGEEDDMKEIKPAKGHYQLWKRINFYHKSETDKNCGCCVSSVRCEYHDKYYWKCELMGCSHSEASDVRKSYVCVKYERRKKND